MYRVFKNNFLGDSCIETLGSIDSAIAFAKSEKKKNGGYYYVKDKSGTKVWNT
ncbi:MAG: hypothetical protein J7J96_09700 [Sulfurimonas sp.]|nr:hypothetical protein [Sulfurimonas sp.]